MFNSSSRLGRRINSLLSIVDPRSRPSLRQIRKVANRIDPLTLNIKQMGYALARDLAAALPPHTHTEASKVDLRSSLSTQGAIASPWVAHWCSQLRIPVVFHRKIWELCFVLQALYNDELIRPGARGLGFGCGTEPLPSYLASRGVQVTMTDLAPEQSAGLGWIGSGQHAGSVDSAYMSHLVSRELFDQLVEHRFVDMNDIPRDLVDYDFCWSICALEHLGSIENGLSFIANSMATLRPGGLAIHTTEFNIRDDGPTIDNRNTVAFQSRHLESLADNLRARGHDVVPFDFSLGDGPLDRFVDLPPFHHDLPANIGTWLGQPAHLKVAFENLVLTCAGLIIRKKAVSE